MITRAFEATKKRLSQLRKTEGFSMVETLVAIFVTSIIGAVIVVAIVNSLSTSDNAASATMTQRELLDATSSVSRDISTTTEIYEAGDYYLSMKSKVQGDTQDITYFYYNPDRDLSEFVQGLVEEYGDELPTTPTVLELRENADGTHLLRPLVGEYKEQENIPLFSYFDNNGEPIYTGAIEGTLDGALDDSQVRAIRLISMRFAATPTGREKPLELATSVTPRLGESGGMGTGTEEVLPAPAATVLKANLPAQTQETTLEWTRVEGATGYTLYRNNRHQAIRPMVIGTFDANTVETVDTDITWGETYEYFVVVSGPGGTSTNSNVAQVTATPEAPVVQGKVDDRTNIITWNQVNGVAALATPANSTSTGYKLYRIGDNGTTTLIYNGHNRSFEDSGRNFGDLNKYYVIPYNQGGEGFKSNEASLITRPPATTISGTLPARTNTANLSWLAAKRADNYTVKTENRKTSASNTTVNGLNTTRSNLTWGETYHFTVTSKNSGGVSDVSNTLTLTATPPAPTLKGTTSTTTHTLSWGHVNGVGPNAEPVNSTATGYRLYRVVDGNATLIYTGRNTSFSETRSRGTVTQYYVEPYNQGGVGFRSNEVSLTTAPNAPSLTIQDYTKGRDGSNLVSWNKPPTATRYEYRRDTGNPVNLTATSRTDSNPGHDSHRTYYVKACNAAGCSPEVNIKGKQPPGPFSQNSSSQQRRDLGWVYKGYLAEPSSNNASVTLGWSASSGANKYTVKRGSTVQYDGTGRSTTHNNVAPNQTYTYTIEAVGNTSGLSRKVTTKVHTSPAAPREVRLWFHAVNTSGTTRGVFKMQNANPGNAGGGKGAYHVEAQVGLVKTANNKLSNLTSKFKWTTGNQRNSPNWSKPRDSYTGGIVLYRGAMSAVSGHIVPKGSESSAWSVNPTNGTRGANQAAHVRTYGGVPWGSTGHVVRGTVGLGKGNYPNTSDNVNYYRILSK